LGIEVDVKLEQLDKPYVSPQQPTLFPVSEQNQTQALPQLEPRVKTEDFGETSPLPNPQRQGQSVSTGDPGSATQSIPANPR
jgi:hypothetical protein